MALGRYNYAFKQKDTQKAFERAMEIYLKPFPNNKYITSKISYVVARSVISGRYGEILKENKNNFDNATINYENYVGGKAQTDSSPTDFKNYNAFTHWHERNIYKTIENMANGSLLKLINEVAKLNDLLIQEMYQYNVVWYGYYKP